MLQASLHNKSGQEDNLTSSSLGVLQFLPDNLFWQILQGACGNMSQIPSNIGTISSFSFWPKFRAKGTYNLSSVEPDLWIETELYHILIEVKRIDDACGYAQCQEQWFNEIKALKNEIEDDGKSILLIALGGNENQKDTEIEIDGGTFPVFTASWFNLLNTLITIRNNLIQKQESKNILRIIETCISGLSMHGYFQCIWFETMTSSMINKVSLNIFKSLWNISCNNDLGSLTCSRKDFSNIKISEIWKIW